MVEGLRGALVISFFTVVIWLFAEGESLQQEEISTRVALTSDDPLRYVEVPGEWDGRVRVVLEGSSAAIEDARDELSGQVRLPIGLGRVPREPGRHTLNLLDVLAEQERIRRTGVRVVNVTPPQAAIGIRELEYVELPVKVDLPGLELLGSARPSRDRVRVAAPKALIEELEAAGRWPLAIIATVPADELSGLGEGVSVDRQATLELPPELEADPAVKRPTRRVNLAFTVRARVEVEERRAAVWVLLPPFETANWTAATKPGDETVDVRVEAPEAALERLRSGDDKLVGVVALSSDELTGRIQSKPLGFALLRDGVTPTPLPASMSVVPAKPEIGLDIAPRGDGS